MRVLHILNDLKPSGAEMMYVAAADVWLANGVTCDILSCGEERGVFAQNLLDAGFTVHHIPFRRSPKFLLDIHKFMRLQRYDVVHIDPERGSFWYGVIAKAVGSKKIIRTIHNVFPFSGWLGLKRRLQRRCLRALGVQMVSISPSVRKTECEYFSNPTDLIPNWYDNRLYRPAGYEQRALARARLSIPQSAFVLSSIAGCWSYKNHQAILRGLAMMPSEYEIVYLHAGMEDSDCTERRLASSLGLGDRVRFLGIVPQTLPILHASDAYVMPSLYEGFGCAAVEAMGAGVPVILSQVSGLEDFRGAIPDIFWTDPTPESIAAVLRRVYEAGPIALQEIGRRQSEAAEREFGLEQGAAMYLDLYRSA